MQKTDKIKTIKQNIVTTMSKPHAYLHPIYKTPEKFQKYGDKTVEGVALTKHTPIVYEVPKVKKWDK